MCGPRPRASGDVSGVPEVEVADRDRFGQGVRAQSPGSRSGFPPKASSRTAVSSSASTAHFRSSSRVERHDEGVRRRAGPFERERPVGDRGRRREVGGQVVARLGRHRLAAGGLDQRDQLVPARAVGHVGVGDVGVKGADRSTGRSGRPARRTRRRRRARRRAPSGGRRSGQVIVRPRPVTASSWATAAAIDANTWASAPLSRLERRRTS